MFNFGGGFGANLLLNGVLKTRRFSHAYLFCGEEFIGKRLIAKKFAMSVFCRNNVEGPCFSCEVCKRVLSKSYVDYCEISSDVLLKGGGVSVQRVRQLISDAFVKPFEGQFKIFLISRVDKMLPAAANALLKLIEEPPKSTIFLLTATNRFAVLKTIASRCVWVNVFCEGVNYCFNRLKEEFPKVESSSLMSAIRLGEGSFNRASLILSNSDWQLALEIARGLFDAYIYKNELQFLEFLAKLELNSSLVFIVFKFFNLGLNFLVRCKLSMEERVDLVFLNEVKRVLECFERINFMVLSGCNLKLALTELCCVVFQS